MSWKFVKQPNGRLARYSGYVDHFTHLNLTEEAAMEYCTLYARMSNDEAETKVKSALLDRALDVNDGAEGSGHDRWDECIQRILDLYKRNAEKTSDDIVDAIEQQNGLRVRI